MILIKNAILVSMNERKSQIEKNMDILINEDKIIKIDKNIPKKEDYKIIDATNKVVMPGLINTHAHVPMSIFRETVDGCNLQEWLTDIIWPMEDKMTDEDIYYASLLSFIEMVRTGCTCINEMYFMANKIIKALEETGIRLQTSRTLMNIAGDEDGNKRLKELDELIEKYKNHNKKLTFNIAIHGLYTSNEKYVEKCIEFARKKELPIHMHFCENTKEVNDIKEAYNKEPSQVLVEHFKGVHTILAHCVKLTEADIEKIKDLDIHVAHCPISNLKLGCGTAPVQKMIEKGINVSLGTDGQGSGTSLDMFEVMKFTGLLQKGMYETAEKMPAYEVLKMATINGAKTLGLENEIGSIEIGKQADIIICNLDSVTLKPVNDLISEIVYNMKGSDVNTTIVAGKILMKDRKLKTLNNENEIYNKCEEIINRLKSNV